MIMPLSSLRKKSKGKDTSVLTLICPEGDKWFADVAPEDTNLSLIIR